MYIPENTTSYMLNAKQHNTDSTIDCRVKLRPLNIYMDFGVSAVVSDLLIQI